MAQNSTDVDLLPVFSYYYSMGFHGYTIGIFTGSLVTIVAKLINIPHQIPASAAGILIGITARHLDSFGDLKLDALLLHSIYVPLLVAKIVYNLDHYLLKKSLTQIFIIGMLGTALFVFFFGLILSLFQKNELPLLDVMLISLTIAPNDNPELPISDGIKNLETLMYGETVLGVCVCTLARIIFVGVLKMHITEWYHVVGIIIRYLGFSIPIGIGCGCVMSLLFRELYDDSLNALAAYLSASYFVYILCEQFAWSSGTLGCFITLYMMTSQRTNFLSRTEQDVKLCINVAYVLVHIFLSIICIADSFYWIESQGFVMKLLESFAIYAMGYVVRLVIFLMASIFLSRTGFGFEFASLVTIFWAIQKGPLQIIQVFRMQSEPGEFLHLEVLNSYVLYYVILTNFVNGITLKILLKAFGLSKLSQRRKTNVSMAITSLNQIGGRILSTLKGNRYYSDVNWAVIQNHTTLKNPYGDFSGMGSKDTVICNVCHAAVPLKFSRDEFNENLKDVTLRTLKAQRMSFLEQHILGLLTNEDIKLLSQAIDIAMDTYNINIKIDSLLSCMESKDAYIIPERVRQLLTINNNIQLPTTPARKRCYRITNSLIFEFIMVFIVLTDFALLLIRLYVNDINSCYECLVVLFTIYVLCYCSYIVEFLLRLYSYSYGSFRKDLKFYVTNHWNKMDVCMIAVSTIDIVPCAMYLLHLQSFYFIDYIKFAKLVICLKPFRIVSKVYPLIVSKIEKKKEMKLMRAFGVAQAIVISCDEVINLLPTLTEHSNIRNVIRKSLEQTSAKITQNMGMLEKARPTLTTTIKTRQALKVILEHLKAAICELRSSGLIDAFEYHELSQTVSVKNRCLSKVRIIEAIQPVVLFNEIPWIQENDEVLDYLFKNVKTKIYNAGDIICSPGDYLPGIFVIIEGYFKVTYFPTSEVLANLKQNGELPAKEFLDYMRFDEVHETYLCCGNRMGELAILANRPYHCSIDCEAPSQVFIIPKEILDKAQELSSDPVLGISANIWKAILFGLGHRLILTTNAYQSATKQEAYDALIRAVVPNTNYYRVIDLTQVDDVLLLEGSVVDYNTNEVYTAPCPMPKHVKKLLMPSPDTKVIDTKLMFVPDSNTDEYDMMLNIQRNSELLSHHEETLLSETMNAKRRFESRMFSLSKPKSGNLSYGHKFMSFIGGQLVNASDD